MPELRGGLLPVKNNTERKSAPRENGASAFQPGWCGDYFPPKEKLMPVKYLKLFWLLECGWSQSGSDLQKW